MVKTAKNKKVSQTDLTGRRGKGIMEEDRRSKLSKQMMKDALTELMKTKSIHEISVKRLCETADVNRSTFYRYYSSPYDLYDEIIEDVSRDLISLTEATPPGPHRLRAVLTQVLTYVERQRPLMLVLLSSNGDLNIGERMSNFVSRFTPGYVDTEFARYCTQFITAGLISITWLWLNQEDRKSPREMAAMLSVMLLHGVKRAMTISGSQPG